MLIGLSIRDVVLIERLSLSFSPGLTVLTGETGAGKSILLDALALALGERADSGLIRAGAAQASVTAEFQIAGNKSARNLLNELGMPSDSELAIRRTVSLDGRSRSFVNDHPVSAGILRRIAEMLVEIHGQFETHGLIDPQTHRQILDAYGALTAQADRARHAWIEWQEAKDDLALLTAGAEKARAEEIHLREVLSELDQAAPKVGEEATLTEVRQRLQHREKLLEAMNAAQRDLSGDRGAELALSTARRALERVADKAGGGFDSVISALDRAQIEVADAIAAIDDQAASMEDGVQGLDTVDDRLFALRRIARRHGVAVDDLPGLRDRLAAKLAGIDGQDARLAAAAKLDLERRATFIDAARILSEGRQTAGRKLDAAVGRELKPLKLDQARFTTVIRPLEESEWGENGAEHVSFQVATNPGQPPGPIAKIASGGELARFMLALKVVLAGASSVPVLIFDEVDTGIGGATADAVGERLARLAQTVQVLVVTHSPQVAARGTHHWRVRKIVSGGAIVTDVTALEERERREEIARMLSAAEITDEARAAADRLLRPAGNAA